MLSLLGLARTALPCRLPSRFPQVRVLHAPRVARAHASTTNTTPSNTSPLRAGMAHWEVLLRARAIESQCYIVAAAQVGVHNASRASYGHAMIVDPWGTVIAQCGGVRCRVLWLWL